MSHPGSDLVLTGLGLVLPCGDGIAAARAIHLEKSGNEISEKSGRLKLQYFHAHHAVIDKGARELYSAQIIRKKQIQRGVS